MKQVVRKLYQLLPFKMQLYTLLKAFWKPGERIYRHLHFTEPFEVKVDETKKFKLHNGTFIENEIFWEGLTGKWEMECMKLWLKLCTLSDIIFDIGANTGVYSLVAKTVNPACEVYAFEPHPMFFKKLQENIAINQFNIKAYNNSVYSFDGPMSIPDYSGHTATIEVDSITLDTFIDQNKIKKIDLFKIDVETHEPEVLAGFLKHLPAFQPTFLIEILNPTVAEAVFNFVNNHNYLYFNIDQNGGIRQTETIEQSNYYNYLLCNADIATKLGLLKK